MLLAVLNAKGDAATDSIVELIGGRTFERSHKVLMMICLFLLLYVGLLLVLTAILVPLEVARFQGRS